MEKINSLTLSWQHCRIDMILFWISDQVCASKDFQCFYSPAILNNLLCFSNLSSNLCLCFGVFFYMESYRYNLLCIAMLSVPLKIAFLQGCRQRIPIFYTTTSDFWLLNDKDPEKFWVPNSDHQQQSSQTSLWTWASVCDRAAAAPKNRHGKGEVTVKIPHGSADYNQYNTFPAL